MTSQASWATSRGPHGACSQAGAEASNPGVGETRDPSRDTQAQPRPALDPEVKSRSVWRPHCSHKDPGRAWPSAPVKQRGQPPESQPWPRTHVLSDLGTGTRPLWACVRLGPRSHWFARAPRAPAAACPPPSAGRASMATRPGCCPPTDRTFPERAAWMPWSVAQVGVPVGGRRLFLPHRATSAESRRTTGGGGQEGPSRGEERREEGRAGLSPRDAKGLSPRKSEESVAVLGDAGPHGGDSNPGLGVSAALQSAPGARGYLRIKKEKQRTACVRYFGHSA